MVTALLVVALVLLLLAAFAWPPHTGRVSLGWLGLAFFVGSVLWPAAAQAVR